MATVTGARARSGEVRRQARLARSPAAWPRLPQSNKSTKTRLYKLHGFKGTIHDGRRWVDHNHQELGEQALQIYVFNALGKNEGPVIDSIVYEEVSRFNHGCEPSAEYVINEEDGTITVAATKGIRAGDEITLQYTEPAQHAG